MSFKYTSHEISWPWRVSHPRISPFHKSLSPLLKRVVLAVHLSCQLSCRAPKSSCSIVSWSLSASTTKSVSQMTMMIHRSVMTLLTKYSWWTRSNVWSKSLTLWCSKQLSSRWQESWLTLQFNRCSAAGVISTKRTLLMSRSSQTTAWSWATSKTNFNACRQSKNFFSSSTSTRVRSPNSCQTATTSCKQQLRLENGKKPNQRIWTKPQIDSSRNHYKSAFTTSWVKLTACSENKVLHISTSCSAMLLSSISSWERWLTQSPLKWLGRSKAFKELKNFVVMPAVFSWKF